MYLSEVFVRRGEEGAGKLATTNIQVTSVTAKRRPKEVNHASTPRYFSISSRYLLDLKSDWRMTDCTCLYTMNQHSQRVSVDFVLSMSAQRYSTGNTLQFYEVAQDSLSEEITSNLPSVSETAKVSSC